MGQFPFHPATYDEVVRREVPAYEALQDAVAEATAPVRAGRVLDLGTGTGATAVRVLARHPAATLVGVDESETMLGAARGVLPARTELVVGRLEDPLPPGPFELVVSALAVHHLDGPGKAALFRRVHGVLRHGGRFVLGDVVVPDDPAEAVTPVEDGHDRPDTVADQLRWLTEAGFEAQAAWRGGDLAVLVGDRRGD